MFKIKVTDDFSQWLAQLRDLRSKMRITKRIKSLECGNFGDVKALGGTLSELRIHSGQGCRVYFTQYGRTGLLILCGGNKSTQSRDILKTRDFMKRPEVEKVLERKGHENKRF